MRRPGNNGFKPPSRPAEKKIMETPKPEEIKTNLTSESMQIEEPKECVDVDALLEEKYNEKNGEHVDLRDDKDKKNKKKPAKDDYDIGDTVLRDITLNGNIHVRLVSNVNGYFVDIRKFQNEYPTKKGIKFLATKFAIAADYLKKDLEKLLPPNP